MKNRKPFDILAILFLVLNIFSNIAFAEACLCGNTCLHSFQSKEKTKTILLFHMWCLGNTCKSCDQENGQTFKAASPTTWMFNIKTFDTEFIIVDHLDYPSIYHALEDFDSFYNCKIIISSSIYLQNLSILC